MHCLNCENERMITKQGKESEFCSMSCRSKYYSKQTLKKRKKTNIKKYGVDNPSKSSVVIKKRDKTNLEKYGVKNPFQLEEVREKQKETCLKRYGVEYAVQSEKIKERQKIMWESIYGSHPWKDKEIRQKRNNTMLQKYGVEHPFQNKDIYEKYIHTCRQKYGTSNPMKCKNVVDKGREKKISAEAIRILDDASALSGLCEQYSNKRLASYLDINIKTLTKYLKKYDLYVYKHSIIENDIHTFLDSENISYISNSKRIIPPLEIDIFIPKKSVAIECNGAYWHAEKQGRDKNYHLYKTNRCNKNGIQLLHIWEHNWLEKPEIVKSRISSVLGKNKRIFARKCVISLVDNQEKISFLNKNHIQGNSSSSYNVGLYNDGTLVAIMTFGKSRYNKKFEWELLRYCSSLNTNIIGGPSKLFSFFIKKQKPQSVISYSDKASTSGNMYEKLGFRYMHSSAPSYKYTKDYINFESRIAYQKHKLREKLEVFDARLTEWENMQANGYDRIWDCGNDVWGFIS